MFAFDAITVATQGVVVAAAVILLAWLWQALAELTSIEERLMRLPLPVKAVCYSAVTVGVLIASSAAPRAFVYFQF